MGGKEIIIPAEFEGVFQGIELTEREIGFLIWMAGWDRYTITNLQSVIQKVRAKAIGDVIQPSNEPPPCYQPDGGSCAYQCYDGDDEPIDKCKECPLCYSDKQRHHTPPNEPLTQADLNEMYLNEVWLGYPDGSGETALVVNGKIYSTSSIEGAGLDLEDYIMGETLDAPTGTYKVYRRLPEVSP